MFENITKFFKKFNKNENKTATNSRDAAKERLHLVLMQDRANVSADFLELMKQEIIEVIKKYIDVDETAIDVRLTNKENGDGTNGAPALYANIPIINIKNEARKVDTKKVEKEVKKQEEKNPIKATAQENDKKETDKQEESKTEKNEQELSEKEASKPEVSKDNQEVSKQKENNKEKDKQEIETKEAIKSKK